LRPGLWSEPGVRDISVQVRAACLRHAVDPSGSEGRSRSMKPGAWKSGEGRSVRIGYKNRNGQLCCGYRGVRGTDHGQYAYKVECTKCGYVYGANGTDMHLRLCPECQGGAPGISY